MLEEFLLLLGELGRSLHADFYDEVALAVGVEVGNALAAEFDFATTLSAFGDLDAFDAIEGLEFKFGAECGLRKADWNDAV